MCTFKDNSWFSWKSNVEPTLAAVSFHGTYHHGGLTGKLTKCVQYGINDLYLYRSRFYVPDILVLVVLYQSDIYKCNNKGFLDGHIRAHESAFVCPQ